MAVQRGCGVRVKGALYLEVGLSPTGSPIEDFLVDPPVPVDTDALGITPVGVKLIERNGLYHVFDWVGSQHYLNVADFIEEVRRFGLSRRVSQNIDFSKLTAGSKIVLMHSRAYIKNYQEYASSEVCPCHRKDHKTFKVMCARLWWEDIDDGEPVGEVKSRHVVRTMPSFQYYGLSTPQNLIPERQLAIFAMFPIQRFAVVNDPDSNKAQEVMKKAKNSQFPVVLVEE